MKKTLALAIKNWLHDDPLTQSAAAAYYAIFSLPGLMIIIMALAALFFDQEQIETQVLNDISNTLGANTADSIEQIVESTQQKDRDRWAMIVGVATLFFGATGLFAQLQRSLNHIWEVEVKKSTKLWHFLKRRLISFGLILVIGFLLLVSLTITTALTVFGEWVASHFSPQWAFILVFLNFGLSLLTITTLFTLIFKILPDAKVQWPVAFLGGALSAVLFTIGQYLITFYFEWVEPQSSFGAAGSIILLMIWVFYSCMILTMGAEFSRTYAMQTNSGRKAPPENIAKRKARKD